MRYRLIAGCLCLALSSAFAPADVKLPALFSPHAVIQRDAPVPVWGWADPGERVTAELKDGERTIGMSVSTVAGRQGRWRVTLGPFAAGGPWRLAVSGRNTVNVDDVLVGEVWICSGQSNMQWSVSHANDAEQEVRAADHPGIRLFSVPHQVSPAAVRDVSARWEACTPQTVGRFSAVGYFFGREMHRHLGVPVGLIHSSWGGTPAEAWTRRRELARHAVLAPILERYDRALAGFDPAMKSFRQRLAEWKERAAAARSAGRRPPPRPPRPFGPDHPHAPGGLWRGMIAPLVPFAVRGVIWYQGEANATRAFQYRTLFPAMIRDWRQAWGQGDFPFLFVQLANFRARKPEPADSDWAELREAQAMALELPATGMAVAIDIGEANDIHPRNKQEVGRRLALQARAVAHGETLVHSGPMLERAEPDGGAITVRFTHVGSGLVVRGERLEGFEVAGADGKFHRADAELLLPERADAAAAEPAVRVTSSAVPQPLHVRYAWADNPAANLYNREGLPAAPFRTDDLPGVTAGAR